MTENKTVLKIKSSSIAVDYRKKKSMSKHDFDKSFDKDLEKITTKINRTALKGLEERTNAMRQTFKDGKDGLSNF